MKTKEEIIQRMEDYNHMIEASASDREELLKEAEEKLANRQSYENVNITEIQKILERAKRKDEELKRYSAKQSALREVIKDREE